MKGIKDTSNRTYRQLMGNGLRFEIPKFQRDYSWELEQWDDLWQDLLSVLHAEDEEEEEDHYMGYLVLQTDNNKVFQIIDGQQRFTTLSLLILAVLKAINDLIEKGIEPTKNKSRQEALRNSYIGTLNPATLISNNKLKLNRNADEYYRNYLVILADLRVRNTNLSEKKMKKCFDYFYKKVVQKYTTGEHLAAFVDTFVDKLYFTVIEVGDQLNAFKVFETLNARGVQLSSADLLKNYFFSIVDTRQPHKEEIEAIEELWSGVISKLGKLKFEDFLRYYWNSNHKTVRKNQLFKTIRKEIKTEEEVFMLLRALARYVHIFKALQDPTDDLWQDPKYTDSKTYIEQLKLFQIRQTNSILLAGYIELSPTEFIKLVKICATISFRYNVIGGLNPNEQEDVYNKISNIISTTKTLPILEFAPIYNDSSNFVIQFTSKQFKPTNKNHKIVKFIFSKIEAHEYQHKIDYTDQSFTVEHILPQNSTQEAWSNFSYEQAIRARFRLGNLTILERNLNEKIKNEPFLDKKSSFEKSKFETTKQIASTYRDWKEEDIIARQRKLAKAAKSIWQIQELEKR